MLFQVAEQHFTFRHKLGAKAHQSAVVKFRFNGIAQFTGPGLLQYHHVNVLNTRLVFQQHFCQRGFEFMDGAGHALQNQRHIRQTVVRQVRHGTGPGTEHPLQVIQHRHNVLIFFAHLLKGKTTGKMAEKSFVQ